jgi:lipoyl(octanoyl) transferase
MKLSFLGLCPYADIYQKMQDFTASRDAKTEDEIWFCEHPPVFTLGWNGDAADILDHHGIPVVRCDRGGQVTYHGPGQLMVYFLVDLKRKKQGVAAFVCEIEKMVIALLQQFHYVGHLREGMPGVYVDHQKICSIGLRVKKGATYHGLALNVAMDLTPFSYINPCGYQGLVMTQLSGIAFSAVESKLAEMIRAHYITAQQPGLGTGG